MGMNVSRVDGSINFGFEVGIVVLQSLVKVDQMHIDIIDYFAFSWPFGEKDGRTSDKSLCIDTVLGDKWQYLLEEGLFASIISYWRTHVNYKLVVVPLWCLTFYQKRQAVEESY